MCVISSRNESPPVAYLNRPTTHMQKEAYCHTHDTDAAHICTTLVVDVSRARRRRVVSVDRSTIPPPPPSSSHPHRIMCVLCTHTQGLTYIPVEKRVARTNPPAKYEFDTTYSDSFGLHSRTHLTLCPCVGSLFAVCYLSSCGPRRVLLISRSFSLSRRVACVSVVLSIVRAHLRTLTHGAHTHAFGIWPARQRVTR